MTVIVIKFLTVKAEYTVTNAKHLLRYEACLLHDV